MVYVGGRHPSSPQGFPSFIDPALAVATSNPDTSGAEMGYWPSYSHIPPRSRLAYLQWLAGGKQDPAGNIGYIFLYFYGLERRLFVDRAGEEEGAAIAAEVERLRSIYGANSSFSGYSRGLLDALETKRLAGSPAALAAFKPDLQTGAPTMPLPLKLAIAAKVVQGQSLPFELAMAGLLGLGWDALPVNHRVLEHARPQLLSMMRPVFARTFPAGFTLRNRKDSRLVLQHRCATAGLVVDLAVPGATALPDPATLTWNKLAAVVGPIATDLEPYAKLVSYHPERAASLAALSALPPSARGEAAEGPARGAIEWLKALPKPIAAVPVPELVQRTLGDAAKKWTHRNHKAATEALAANFYGLEPATLQGGAAAGGDAVVFLFPDPDAGSPRSAAYHTASVGAEIISILGRLDPAVSGRVEEAWIASIAQSLLLKSVEHTRLAARLRWLSGTKPSLSRIKARLADAPSADKAAIAWSAATAAASVGLAAPAQVAVLEKVYDQLGLERRELYSTLHSASARSAVAADEPVTVATGTGEVLHAIPAAPAGMTNKTSTEPLDEGRIRRIRAETERVDAVLAEVFAEDENEGAAIAVTQPDAQDGNTLAGLDAAHAKLARLLSQSPSWSRIDLEAIAKSCGLFADGALEIINEWAFDHFDVPLVEDGDPATVDVTLLPAAGSEADAA